MKDCAGLPAASARLGSAITKFSNANLSFTTHFTQNANAESAKRKLCASARWFFRAQTQSGHPAHRDLCHRRGRGALDAFRAEVFASARRDGSCNRSVTLLGAIYAYPGGLLVDFWGHRRAFIIFNLVSISGYVLVLLIPHWGAVIAGMFLFLSWTCFSLPATFSLVGATLEANRHSMGVGIQSVIKRLPIMIAPLFGGMLIDRFGIISGVRIALVISIFLSTLTILVQRQLHDEMKQEVAAEDRWNFWRSLHEFNAPMRRLLLSDILVRFCERIPYAWVVIFAMDYIGVSGRQVGILTTVEMLAATLCIIPASHFADRHGREPFVIVTFIMFTLFPISLLVSRSFSALVIAFMIRGFKEFGDTSRKALIIGYCEPQRCGQMVGAYYLVRDLIVSLGAILGAYLWKLGPALNFVGAAALGVVGTIFYVKTIRDQRDYRSII
ncbi:MAG: MFS transporter [Verrucomicrobia bacterium]|nr:MAG: MFS transporter [Verrucomicrobiota bacterium]